MDLAPYLFFDGRAEEAIEFYKRTLGAEVEMIMRFADAPEGGPHDMPAEMKTKIMHASLKVGGASLMASDGMCTGNKPSFAGVSLSLTVPDVPTAERLFGALSAEGEVRQPLTETFFAPRFGMVADKFGVGWMIVVDAKGVPPQRA